MIQPKHILISRTDSIGDVILTLPLCAAIKELYPHCKLTFLGKTYTKDVISSFESVDDFLDWSELEKCSDVQAIEFLKGKKFDTLIHVFPNKRIGQLMKKAGVKNRIGTSHRLHHWFTCNIRPSFTRKNSPLHESQLNFKLAQPIGLLHTPTIEEVASYTRFFNPQTIALPSFIEEFIKQEGKYFLLHPKSQGSALEWPIEKYMELANKLVQQGHKVIFTGTDGEGLKFRSIIPTNPSIIDSTGHLSLQQLIFLIQQSNGLVACSTGPLHIAAFSGTTAVGLFSSRKPIHPGRWQPIGKNATALVNDPTCEKCAAGKDCKCIELIEVEQVYKELIGGAIH